EPLYRRSLAIYEKTLGPAHPEVAASLNHFAELYLAQNRVAEGLISARRASAILAIRYLPRDAIASRGAASEQHTAASGFEQHVLLLERDIAQNPAARAADTDEAFAVGQLARANDTADQVAKMAARYASGSDALAQIARERQDLLARIQQI